MTKGSARVLVDKISAVKVHDRSLILGYQCLDVVRKSQYADVMGVHEDDIVFDWVVLTEILGMTQEISQGRGGCSARRV